MSSSDAKVVPFHASASEQTAQLSVYDGSLRQVAGGFGSVEAALPEGLYKIRARVGDREASEVVSHSAADPVAWRWSAPLLSSPAPMDHSVTKHEYHEEGAEVASREPPAVTLGDGARVMVFVRDWNSPERPREICPELPLTGLTLARFDDSLPKQRLADTGRCETACADPWGTWTAALDAGAWRLSLDTGRGPRLEQTLYVPAGWSTWYFAWRTAWPQEGCVRWRADLANATILLGKGGFDRNDRESTLVAQAHAALLDPAPPDREMAWHLLNAKWDNPMLGLYGAHLALRASGGDARALPRWVVDNIERLVGPDHPDVRALRLALDPGADVAPFTYPPMMRASWDIVVRASARRPGLVPDGSFAAGVSRRLWGVSPFLLWMTEAPNRGLGGALSFLGPGLEDDDPYDDVGAAILGALIQGPATRPIAPVRGGTAVRRPAQSIVIDVPAAPPDTVLAAVRLPAGEVRRAYASLLAALRRDARFTGATTTPVTPRRYHFRPEGL